MAILFTMTACVSTSDTQASELPYIYTVDEKVEVEIRNWEPETKLKVKQLKSEDIQEMKQEDFSNFFAEMVNISETENLTASDMYQIGHNFYSIWYHQHWNYIDSSSYDESEFEKYSYEAFENVYDQATSFRVPLEKLNSWENVPVTKILCKYYSSSNFSVPEQLDGYGLCFLNEDDVSKVAETFFKNPLMATNSHIPCAVIRCNYNNLVTDMAWNHLLSLSESSSLRVSSFRNSPLSFSICSDILTLVHTATLDYANMHYVDKIAEIAKNILENPHYDVYWKYIYFCHAFYDEDSQTYKDETISNMAFSYLFELAHNADEETTKQIKDLCVFLSPDISDELLTILENN